MQIISKSNLFLSDAQRSLDAYKGTAPFAFGKISYILDLLFCVEIIVSIISSIVVFFAVHLEKKIGSQGTKTVHLSVKYETYFLSLEKSGLQFK